MSAATVPAVYATALYEAAVEQGVAPKVVEDCAALSEALRAAPDVIERVEHPAISRQQAGDMIAALFGGQVNELVLTFLRLLVERNRFAAVIEICDELVAHADRSAGVIQVQVAAATRIGSEVRQRLNDALADQLGKGVVVTTAVDPTLLGGFTLRVGDRLFDASLRRRLDGLHDHLMAAPLGSVWDADSSTGDNA